MKITDVNIPNDKCIKNGLDDIVMDHLQQVVLVVGKNGSGKSRLLSKIKTAVEQQVLPSEIRDLQLAIANNEGIISTFDSEILKFQDPTFMQHIVEPQRTQEIESRKQNRVNAQQNIDNWKNRLASSFIKYDGDIAKRNIIYFLPKKLDLRDPRSLTPIDIENRANNVINTIDVDQLNEYSLSRIQDLHTQYWNATHQDTRLSHEKIEEITNSYLELQKLTKELLGVEFGSDERNHATLFDLPIGISQLSDGQKILLQLTVAIHAHNLKLSETILILDEPENHLHPAAIIEIIEKLQQTISHGQIWIATHSISIIAHFSEEASLYYLDNGKTHKAGAGKTIVLESLLGGEDHIRRQAAFLEEPLTHEMNTYSAQCLLPPAAVTTGPSDPQMRQIRDVLYRFPEEVIKVLDFGAGKGRLITNLLEATEDITNLRTKLNYIAMDCDSENRLECEGEIGRVYGDANNRWFKTYQDLISRHNKGSFDVVVLTNVLHEISPKNWLDLFGVTGELTELLDDNGQLLLVEDQRIPLGEAAHEFGFIVLDTIAIKDLFKISGDDSQIIQASERDGRLKAHLIPKSYLARCDHDSVQRALHSHCSHSKLEIETLRARRDKKQARLFAFWIHQYANTKLALETRI